MPGPKCRFLKYSMSSTQHFQTLVPSVILHGVSRFAFNLFATVCCLKPSIPPPQKKAHTPHAVWLLRKSSTFLFCFISHPCTILTRPLHPTLSFPNPSGASATSLSICELTLIFQEPTSMHIPHRKVLLMSPAESNCSVFSETRALCSHSDYSTQDIV